MNRLLNNLGVGVNLAELLILWKLLHLISSSKIIIISLAAFPTYKVSLPFKIVLKHFIISLQVVRSIDRSQQILFDTLFLLIIMSVLCPHRNRVSLQSCSYLNPADVVLSLKLVTNDSEQQVFPKPVGKSLLDPNVPSSALFASVVFPKRFDSFLEHVVRGLLLKLVRSH